MRPRRVRGAVAAGCGAGLFGLIVLVTAGGAPPLPPAAAGAVTIPGVPPVAAAAYQHAALLAAGRGCRVHWSVLAGIGQVESGHAAGRALGANGDTSPPVLGPRLDGGDYPAIADSDGGRWDSDPVWDRAVGPMQFIPSSWELFGTDGNGDGAADPHNLYDAAAAAANHLCGPATPDTPVDLTAGRAALGSAVYGYNHDWAYVAIVLEWADRYTRTAAHTGAPTGGTEGGYTLPVDRSWIVPGPAVLERPHHDYPAWDLPLPEATPVYAVTGGTIAATTGAGSRCGLGLILVDPDGYQWIYCHASTLHVTAGQAVNAGDLVMASGNTGNSTGPHLHLGLRHPDGTNLCPQPLLAAWWNAVPSHPSQAPTGGCTY